MKNCASQQQQRFVVDGKRRRVCIRLENRVVRVSVWKFLRLCATTTATTMEIRVYLCAEFAL